MVASACMALFSSRGGHGGSLIANVRNTNQGPGPLATVTARKGYRTRRGPVCEELFEDPRLPVGLNARRVEDRLEGDPLDEDDQLMSDPVGVDGGRDLAEPLS